MPHWSMEKVRRSSGRRRDYCKLNFKHFVNIKTVNKVQVVNKLMNYNEINILPPSMMLEGES